MPNPFLVALLENINESRKIPFVQVERAVGPILDMFIEKIVKGAFQNDDEYSGNVIKICPEFPLKLPGKTNLSTNIDWIMFNSDRNQILFVELKTSDSSVIGSFSRNNKRKMSQFDYYKDKKQRIYNESGGFLFDELLEIREASKGHTKAKYAYIIGMVEMYRELIRSCYSAKIIYIVPKTSKSKAAEFIEKVLVFSDFPAEITGDYAEEWRIINKNLLNFDQHPDYANELINQKNPEHQPRGYVKFDQLIQICKTHGNSVIISFTGGEKAFANESLDELKNRLHYKWDDAENIGFWARKNWINGNRVLEIMKECHNYPEG